MRGVKETKLTPPLGTNKLVEIAASKVNEEI